MSKEDELRHVLEYLDLELRDVKDRHPYNERKGNAYGVFDRPTNRLLCVYSTLPQIKDWLKKQARKR